MIFSLLNVKGSVNDIMEKGLKYGYLSRTTTKRGEMIKVRRSEERGGADHGWLKTKHTFSFADYYDEQYMGFRSLRVINEDWVKEGQGFGTHPHRDMEIITYVVSGELAHKDNMGNGRIIKAGEVQAMAAGTGITHSEYNPSANEPVHLLQIWIVPDTRGIQPSYSEWKPEGELSPCTTLASKSGAEGIRINQDAELFLVQGELTHKLRTSRAAWLQVIDGEFEVNEEKLKPGDGISLVDEEAVRVKVLKQGRALLFDLK